MFCTCQHQRHRLRNTRFGCRTRTDDPDSRGSSVRTVVLGVSSTLHTFILSEAHDWSGECFTVCPFVALAVYGRVPWSSSMFDSSFFVIIIVKVMKRLHRGREGTLQKGFNQDAIMRDMKYNTPLG